MSRTDIRTHDTVIHKNIMPSFSWSLTEILKVTNTSCVCLQTVTYATSEMGRFGGQTAVRSQRADGHTSLPRTAAITRVRPL